MVRPVMLGELHASLRHVSCEPGVDWPARDGAITDEFEPVIVAFWCSSYNCIPVVFLKTTLIIDNWYSHGCSFRICDFTFQASLYGTMMFET